MIRSIEEINAKIKSGKVVVATAEEVVGLVKDNGVKKAAAMVDVVATGTFGPMCSSGAYFNIKQSTPKLKIGGGKAYLNRVPVYSGLAAADFYLGATHAPDDDPRNAVYPGLFKYGGGNVIEDLVTGKTVNLVVNTFGTDCYPRKEYSTELKLTDFASATMFNPRNCYQLYNVAVNLGDKTIYTYMGVLKPRLGNANYATAGELSPLLNDPKLRTVGMGTRVFFCGAEGYVAWPGTQHVAEPQRDENDLPITPSATMALIGDLKQMDPKYVRAASLTGYGTSLSLGIGLPIPVVDEQVMAHCAISDAEITYPIVDYSEDYPLGRSSNLGRVSMAELMSGQIEIDIKKVPTGCMCSRVIGRQVAKELKERISQGGFLLTQAVAPLPGATLAWDE
jgi:uncharacterized protein (DUF39 family)